MGEMPIVSGLKPDVLLSAQKRLEDIMVEIRLETENGAKPLKPLSD